MCGSRHLDLPAAPSASCQRHLPHRDPSLLACLLARVLPQTRARGLGSNSTVVLPTLQKPTRQFLWSCCRALPRGWRRHQDAAQSHYRWKGLRAGAVSAVCSSPEPGWPWSPPALALHMVYSRSLLFRWRAVALVTAAALLALLGQQRAALAPSKAAVQGQKGKLPEIDAPVRPCQQQPPKALLGQEECRIDTAGSPWERVCVRLTDVCVDQGTLILHSDQFQQVTRGCLIGRAVRSSALRRGCALLRRLCNRCYQLHCRCAIPAPSTANLPRSCCHRLNVGRLAPCGTTSLSGRTGAFWAWHKISIPMEGWRHQARE